MCEVDDVSASTSVKHLTSGNSRAPGVVGLTEDPDPYCNAMEENAKTYSITARLDEQLSLEKSGPNMIALLRGAKTREDLEQGMTNMTNGKDFATFIRASFHGWRNAYYGTTDAPKTFQYIFGNPLVAETMAKHDMFTALNVPLRLLVTEKADRSGTQLVYLQPSTIVAVPVDGEVNEDLKAAAEALDAKVEKLIRTVTSP
ncbi:predicted protein [Postia placenta Mad-698-R]|nr:predicted protein [Postia placenta Mad-698-R]